MLFRYETHCHTSPVSFCGRATARDTVHFYHAVGYDGIFLTNHFLDGNINPDSKSLSYEEQIDYYFSDYEDAHQEGERIGLKVFPGVELSYKGTDFLIYGLDKAWYKAHPEIMNMKKTDELPVMMEAGALVIQAHPYREAHYINHIRLFPRSVHGAEIINSSQAELSNRMAEIYAEQYHLLKTAGSDNHWGSRVFEKLADKGYKPEIAGMCSEEPLESVRDYIRLVKEEKMRPFVQTSDGSYMPLVQGNRTI